MVKLRNPWGKGEWTGAWNLKDPRWTPELKQKLNFAGLGNGVFFLPYSAMIQYFTCFQVCYFEDNYQYSAIKLDNIRQLEEQHKLEQSVPGELQSILINVRIFKEGEYYFSLNQFNKRFFFDSSGYDYSEMIFILYHVGADDEIRFQTAAMKKKKENWFKHKCRPGRYILEVRPYFKTFLKQFTVNVYGPRIVQMKQSSFHDYGKQDANSILIEGLKRLAETTQHDNQKKIGEKRMAYAMKDTREGLGYIIFYNDEPGYELTVTSNLTKCKGIRILSPFPEKEITLTVPDGTRRVILYSADQLPYSVSARFSFSWKRKKRRNKELNSIRLSQKERRKKDRGKNNIFQFPNGADNINPFAELQGPMKKFNYGGILESYGIDKHDIPGDKNRLPPNPKKHQHKNKSDKRNSKRQRARRNKNASKNNHHLNVEDSKQRKNKSVARVKDINQNKNSNKSIGRSGKKKEKQSGRKHIKPSRFEDKSKEKQKKAIAKRSSQQMYHGIKLNNAFIGGNNGRRKTYENKPIKNPLAGFEKVKRRNTEIDNKINICDDAGGEEGILGGVVRDMVKWYNELNTGGRRGRDSPSGGGSQRNTWRRNRSSRNVNIYPLHLRYFPSAVEIFGPL